MRVRKIQLEELVVRPRNARTHDQRNVEAIRDSFVKFGQVEPLLVEKGSNVIIAGHGRVDALRAAGRKWAYVVELDVHGQDAEDLSIRLNRTAELAEWNTSDLAAHLAQLGAEGIDLDGAGWTESEVEKLLEAAETLLAADKLEEPGPVELGTELDRDAELDREDGDPIPPPKKPKSKLGQLWGLGDHRVLCGDSTRAEEVVRLMGGELADLVFTDPPYGVNYSSSSGAAPMAGDLTFTAILFFARLDDILGPKGWCYVCGGYANILIYARLFEEYFHRLPGVIVWDKLGMIIRRSGYHSSYELIFYSYRPGAGMKWFGSRKSDSASNMWRYKVDPRTDREHMTQKPVALASRAIENSTEPTALVCDMFLGSGSTLIAAEQLGRRCYGMEVEPKFVDVTIARWERLTGGKARLLDAEDETGS